MTEAENISLSQTEDQLSTDADSQYKQEVVDDLNTKITELEASKQGGLSPKEFERKDLMLKALGDAVRVVEVTWLKYHQASGTH